MLSTKKKNTTLVGVDIDAYGISAADIAAGPTAPRAAGTPLPQGAFDGGEIVDAEAVSEALRELFTREKLPKQVRLSVASQGVAFRVVRLPLIEDADQLRAAVRFRAQEEIPMPLESAVLDHQIIGAHVEDDGSRQIDVAVVAARRQTVEALVRAARGAGLEPAGVDLAAFGMIRALAGGSDGPLPGVAVGAPEPDTFVQAQLYACLGGVTNLAIAQGYSCLFSRVAQFGVRDIAMQVVADTGLSVEHAEAWLLYAGLDRPLDQLEGDPTAAAAARRALEGSLGRLADELRLSVDYYGAQAGAAMVGDIVLCGWGSAIPGLADALGAVLARPVRVGRPESLVPLGDEAAARFTLAYGLALER
jgi:type IV pilus assembly protein PilM